MKKILIIDDDRELCAMLSSYLGREGFDCALAHDGQSGLDCALNRGPGKNSGVDLILLDVMLPKKSGFDVLSALRAVDPAVPVMMLTARGEPVDRVVGLEMGADDYLPKPFDPRELLARIRALSRRMMVMENRPGPDADTVSIDGLMLDKDSFHAEFENQPLNLTPVEFKVLWALVTNPGKVISRDTLFRDAIGRREHTFDRSLDMHISRLRKKIWPETRGMEKIKNIRGEGYLYAPARTSNV